MACVVGFSDWRVSIHYFIDVMLATSAVFSDGPTGPGPKAE